MNIIRIKDINHLITETLTTQKANDLIQEMKMLYEQLQLILEKDGKLRDTSFCYNWLEEY